MRIKLLTMLLAGLLTVGCSEVKSAKKTENKKEVKKMNTMNLTLSEFKSKVMDYEKNPDKWDYCGDKPAIIDFHATWCGPCKSMAPALDSVAGEYKDRIHVYKVDIDQEQELAGMFGVQSVPTLIFIPMQGQPTMQVGAMNRMQLDEIIKKVLLKD